MNNQPREVSYTDAKPPVFSMAALLAMQAEIARAIEVAQYEDRGTTLMIFNALDTIISSVDTMTNELISVLRIEGYDNTLWDAYHDNTRCEIKAIYDQEIEDARYAESPEGIAFARADEDYKLRIGG